MAVVLPIEICRSETDTRTLSSVTRSCGIVVRAEFLQPTHLVDEPTFRLDQKLTDVRSNSRQMLQGDKSLASAGTRSRRRCGGGRCGGRHRLRRLRRPAIANESLETGAVLRIGDAGEQQAAEALLDVRPGAAEAVVQVHVAKRGVQIVLRHQGDCELAQVGALGITGPPLQRAGNVGEVSRLALELCGLLRLGRLGVAGPLRKGGRT